MKNSQRKKPQSLPYLFWSEKKKTKPQSTASLKKWSQHLISVFTDSAARRNYVITNLYQKPEKYLSCPCIITDMI